MDPINPICLRCQHFEKPNGYGCRAFPDGIPYGFPPGNKHSRPLPGQVGRFVFAAAVPDPVGALVDSLGYEFAEYAGRWGGFAVYQAATYNAGRGARIGQPCYILYNEGAGARPAAPGELRAFLPELSKRTARL